MAATIGPGATKTVMPGVLLGHGDYRPLAVTAELDAVMQTHRRLRGPPATEPPGQRHRCHAMPSRAAAALTFGGTRIATSRNVALTSARDIAVCWRTHAHSGRCCDSHVSSLIDNERTRSPFVAGLGALPIGDEAVEAVDDRDGSSCGLRDRPEQVRHPLNLELVGLGPARVVEGLDRNCRECVDLADRDAQCVELRCEVARREHGRGLVAGRRTIGGHLGHLTAIGRRALSHDPPGVRGGQQPARCRLRLPRAPLRP